MLIHIKKKYGVTYHKKYIYKALKKGFKLGKPRPADVRRDEEAVNKFKNETLPTILDEIAEARASEKKATLVYMDERCNV